MIESPFIVLEDATRDLAANIPGAGGNIYEGSPVALNGSGQLIPAVETSKVYGVSKLDANAYRNFAYGEYGAFGTGKLTVQTKGIVRVKSSVFNVVEISQAPTAAPFTKALYDTTKNYVPGEALYVDATGLISNVAGASKVSLMGRVINKCDAGTGDWLEFELMSGMGVDELAAQD